MKLRERLVLPALVVGASAQAAEETVAKSVEATMQEAEER